MQKIHFSLASLGGINFAEATWRAINQPVVARHLGPIDASKIQICPQTRGQINIEAAHRLRLDHPDVEFRLHANVKTQETRKIFDAVDFDNEAFRTRWEDIRAVSRALNAPCYTLHAGLRGNRTMMDLVDYVRRIEDFMDIPVGVEGHYPTRGHQYLLDSWREYDDLLKSGVSYVIDLSHLNIIVAHEKTIEGDLLAELISSPRCIEIHLSGNDGRRDLHGHLNGDEWWMDFLKLGHSEATIFFEGYVA